MGNPFPPWERFNQSNPESWVKPHAVQLGLITLRLGEMILSACKTIQLKVILERDL